MKAEEKQTTIIKDPFSKLCTIETTYVGEYNEALKRLIKYGYEYTDDSTPGLYSLTFSIEAARKAYTIIKHKRNVQHSICPEEAQEQQPDSLPSS
jgi:hypothetical protein